MSFLEFYKRYVCVWLAVWSPQERILLGTESREQQRFDNKSSHDEYSDSSYSHYHHNDYAQQDFDDDLDSGMFDDDF